MSHPPAKCRQCGVVFPAPDIYLGHAPGITFLGVAGSPCPYCGGKYDILDGVYDAIGQTLTLLSGPSTTFEALRQAAVIARDSKAAGESSEKTAERVSELIPSFKRLAGESKKFLRELAVGTLISVLFMFAEPYVKPLVQSVTGREADTSSPTPAEIHEIVKNAAEETFKAQQAALKKAALEFPPSPKTSPTAPAIRREFIPSNPQFPKSIEKMQREMKKRQAEDRLQRMSKRPERKVCENGKPSDGEQQSDQ